ncbi:hypothetical protein OPIT5_23825 [Opitutaceae bacterium TAV5]|nr:hypothetical protein OPIT5_23825 [Opitutaceae bacterium TAV5]
MAAIPVAAPRRFRLPAADELPAARAGSLAIKVTSPGHITIDYARPTDAFRALWQAHHATLFNRLRDENPGDETGLAALYYLGPVTLGLPAGRGLETHGQTGLRTTGRLKLLQEAPRDLDRTGEAAGQDLSRPCDAGGTSNTRRPVYPLVRFKDRRAGRSYMHFRKSNRDLSGSCVTKHLEKNVFTLQLRKSG